MLGGINPFRQVVGSTVEPLPLPPWAPDEGPQTTLVFACAWVPYVSCALKQLQMQAIWKTDNEADLALALQQANQLQYMLAEAANTGDCVEIPAAFSCGEDFVTSPAVLWSPWEGYATQISGQGFVGNTSSCLIQTVFGSPLTLTHVSVAYTWDGACDGPSKAAGILKWDGTTLTAVQIDHSPVVGSGAVNWYGYDTWPGIMMGMNADASVCTDAVIKVTQALIVGVGSSPC